MSYARALTNSTIHAIIDAVQRDPASMLAPTPENQAEREMDGHMRQHANYVVSEAHTVLNLIRDDMTQDTREEYDTLYNRLGEAMAENPGRYLEVAKDLWMFTLHVFQQVSHGQIVQASAQRKPQQPQSFASVSAAAPSPTIYMQHAPCHAYTPPASYGHAYPADGWLPTPPASPAALARPQPAVQVPASPSPTVVVLSPACCHGHPPRTLSPPRTPLPPPARPSPPLVPARAPQSPTYVPVPVAYPVPVPSPVPVPIALPTQTWPPTWPIWGASAARA